MSRDEQLSWFHGKISREHAEKLVKSEGCEDGTFLVRECNTAAGDFVLTLIYQGEACHYQIRRHGEDAFFSIEDKVKILHGIDTLVDFYQQGANGLVTKLTKHIRKDLPPNDSRSHGSTNLLHRAVLNNNHVVVSELLKCGYRNVDAKNQHGQTAMHLAALHGDEPMVNLLLNAGVSVNCMDTDNNMPLHYACRHQSTLFIRTLIAANANVQGRNIRNGYVPLHEAAKFGNLEAVKELLSVNAPLLPRTSMGEFPIDLAKEANHTEVVSFLETYKLLPANTFKSQWYHGTLTRDEAIEVLKDFAESLQEKRDILDANGRSSNEIVDTSGCFLIRFSERKNVGSGYVLTLLFDNMVKNFIISQSSKYLFIDDGPFLPSLEHLVEHFMRFADGLPINLKYPVVPKPKPPLPLFSTMPKSSHKKNSDIVTLHKNIKGSADEFTINTHHLPQKHIQTISTIHHQSNLKKKSKDQLNSVFSTLRLRSPKKSNLLESMGGTLRKTKGKQKINSEEAKTNIVLNDQQHLQQVETLLKGLSFSTEFSEMNTSVLEDGIGNTEEIYNIPKKNTGVDNSTMLTEPKDDQDSKISSTCQNFEVEKKSNEETEYFTKSDLIIERERNNQIKHKSELLSPNANGYIPTVDIRVFMESNDNAEVEYLSKDILEASAAELRQFSKHPERLDSLISTTSNESSIGRYLNRQASNVSTTTQNSEVIGAGVDSTKPNYLISRDCLILDSVVGEGEFGSVYRGFLIQRDDKTSEEIKRRNVAIKTLRDEHCRSNKQEFLREASVMIRLKHHCIVQLIGISKGETLMMVQELVPLGSMLHFILENKNKINPNYELKLWASQIACGMNYLELHHFVHRDLAARNILLASRNQAKISDFGLSRALGSENDCYQASQGGKWPIKWYAPESYNNGIFSHASDVWSFGVTLWEMFSLGEPPYGDILGREAIQLIERGQRLLQPHLCPDQIYTIMQNCWNYKPKDRPTFRYLTDFFAKDPDYQNILELIKTENIS